MSIQISQERLYCPKPHCKGTIVLPRRSPLGNFQGLDDLPKGIWPATFLCPVCGQEFVGFLDNIQNEVPWTDPSSKIDDLLQVEYEYAQDNFVLRKVIFATCPNGADLESEKLRLLQKLSGIREILNLERFSYERYEDQD